MCLIKHFVNFRPSRTVKLIGYAAEEIGLRGSNAIAQSFKQQGKNIIGVDQETGYMSTYGYSNAEGLTLQIDATL